MPPRRRCGARRPPRRRSSISSSPTCALGDRATDRLSALLPARPGRYRAHLLWNLRAASTRPAMPVPISCGRANYNGRCPPFDRAPAAYNDLNPYYKRTWGEGPKASTIIDHHLHNCRPCRPNDLLPDGDQTSPIRRGAKGHSTRSPSQDARAEELRCPGYDPRPAYRPYLIRFRTARLDRILWKKTLRAPAAARQKFGAAAQERAAGEERHLAVRLLGGSFPQSHESSLHLSGTQGLTASAAATLRASTGREGRPRPPLVSCARAGSLDSDLVCRKPAARPGLLYGGRSCSLATHPGAADSAMLELDKAIGRRRRPNSPSAFAAPICSGHARPGERPRRKLQREYGAQGEPAAAPAPPAQTTPNCDIYGLF